MASIRNDGIKWHAHARVEKYGPELVAALTELLGYEPKAADFERLSVPPEEVTEEAGNILVNAGLTRITSLITGGGGQAFTNTSGRIGAGNSATAATTADTDLNAAAGSANRWFQILDATYPTVATGLITARATFASGDGNFVWNEWAWDIGTPTVASSNAVSATLVNHKVAGLGTKVSGAVWVFTTTITLS